MTLPTIIELLDAFLLDLRALHIPAALAKVLTLSEGMTCADAR